MTLSPLLVTDTNIWSDLINGDIVEEIFFLPFHYISPEFADLELPILQWEKLLGLGVEVMSLDGDQVRDIYLLRRAHHAVSTTDLASFILARDLPAILLSGDKHLRLLAEMNAIEVHEVLWILDQLIFHKVLNNGKAARALNQMLANNARLPPNECEKRLKAWQSDP
jgi:hypothetical protein